MLEQRFGITKPEEGEESGPLEQLLAVISQWSELDSVQRQQLAELLLQLRSQLSEELLSEVHAALVQAGTDWDGLEALVQSSE